MTELSGFTAVQPAAALAPQALQLPSTLADVCTCESGCGASTILKGLAQIVGKGITNLIEIDIQAETRHRKVFRSRHPVGQRRCRQKRCRTPSAVSSSSTAPKSVGMSPEQHAEWSACRYPAWPEPDWPEPPVVDPEPEPEDAPPA
jgi:hypothetical protein